LYPVIYRCEGVESGLYRYHPDSHSLCKCESLNSQIEKLLQDAMVSTAKEEYPQILIIIAARFSRVNWKYQSMAYAIILKNTGALMHNMYLVATAMDLAPSGVGGGNSDLFSTFAKTNYYEESSVGEFILGSKKNEYRSDTGK
jgi:SagB-type dehydrogenase family enzyme